MIALIIVQISSVEMYPQALFMRLLFLLMDLLG